MQRNEVKAFRQRLFRAGFSDIVIYDNYNGSYTVWCVDREGNQIKRQMSLIEIMATPCLVWFD